MKSLISVLGNGGKLSPRYLILFDFDAPSPSKFLLATDATLVTHRAYWDVQPNGLRVKFE